MFCEWSVTSTFGQYGEPIYYWTESLFSPRPIDDKSFNSLDSACYFRYGKEYKGESTSHWELVKVHAVSTIKMETQSPMATKGNYVFRWWEEAKQMAKNHKKLKIFPVDFFK